jgi:P27 family predicted phage terminase small subunit
MAQRGRKPKPTNLKVIQGNPGKRQLNKNEPRPDPALPDPPEHLNEDAHAEWERVARGLYNMGCLSVVDRGTLAAYCQAYGRWVQAERAIAEMAEKDPKTHGLMIKTAKGNIVQNPLVGTANKAKADMMRYASEFGMTPSARSRLGAEGDRGDSNPFADIG